MGTPDVSDVSARDEEEAKEVVWSTTDGVLFFPVLGTSVVVHWRRLGGSGTEPPEGAREMGTVDKYLGKGGRV